MNIRSLTRGDGVVIGAAVLLFIASFLDFVDLGNTAWDSLGTVMSIYVADIAAAALIVVARGLPQTRKFLGMDLGQFGVALSIFAAWTALWTLIDVGSFAGTGLIIGFIATLILAGAAIATPLLPALKPALIGPPKPQAPTPYGAQPQAYGYPGQQ
ncbi:membrane protein, partial [Streptomyces sp. 150FB]